MGRKRIGARRNLFLFITQDSYFDGSPDADHRQGYACGVTNAQSSKVETCSQGSTISTSKRQTSTRFLLKIGAWSFFGAWMWVFGAFSQQCAFTLFKL